jgi:hypothetical protein
MAFSNPIPPIPVIPPDPDLSRLLTSNPPQPLVLLPVRLETRFSPLADGGADLRIRIYPDAIHVDTHEPQLTAQELTWGRHFWDRTWRAASDEAAAQRAWQQLVERFDRPRAAWIARALTPLNSGDRPSTPIPDQVPLPGAIRFPPLRAKANSWTRAPYTRVLPARWWVLGYAGGQITARGAGSPIPDQLNVGPDPVALPADPGDATLPIDDGIKWMTDFAEAEKVGMGIRLRLNRDQAQGFDFLLVFGTKAMLNAPDRTPELAALLDAHHFTSGLSFVRQGTPSNNTADAPSGFDVPDHDAARSYREERTDRAFTNGDGSCASVVSAALGFRGALTATLANLPHATVVEPLDARHMNRALWPATWGYFLEEMAGSPLGPADVAWVRNHFIEYVRASGPLPAMRVGKQPYGLLPVTSINLWKSSVALDEDRTREVAMKDLLLKLSAVWFRVIGQVPHVGRANNPNQDFAEIFSLDAHSSTYGIRHVMGPLYLRQLWTYLVTVGPERNLEFWWKKHKELTKLGLDAAGVTWDPTLAFATYSGLSRRLRGPVAQAEVATEDAPLNPNYITLLLNTADLEALRQERFGAATPRGLLYSLLRHALLLAYWRSAAQLRFDLKRSRPLPLEFEIFELGSPTAWRVLGEPMPGITNQPLWQFLRALHAAPADPDLAACVAPLLELRDSLAHLQQLSAMRLQRLCSSTLDLTSHRLDAWVTSLATRRLADMRAQRPTGLVIGGYGWIVNLKPAAPPEQDTLPGDTGVLFKPAGNSGYTHAPSLAQAATVAVLRSGHLTHADTATPNLLSIDLSSNRVRLATWLLDGVRQGQPLGALLGYRFERQLQDARLAAFLTFFRNVAPLVAHRIQHSGEIATQPIEAVAASNVVDGLVLQRKWKAAGSVAGLFADLTTKPDPDQLARAEPQLRLTLNALDETVDAVSDALLAESVHHAVQGNPTRAAATLDAIATGDAPPPELEVVKTPRTGTAITYRLVTLLDRSVIPSSGWAVSHRASAEPRLNAWAAALLPDPAKVRCAVERVDSATGSVVETRELRVSALGLAPLDAAYASVAGGSAPSEIEQRILSVAAPLFTSAAANTIVRINPQRRADWASDDVRLAEFAEMVRVVRALVTGARGLDATDLNLPEADQPSGVDVTELEARADQAGAAVRRVQADLKSWLSRAGDAGLATVRDLLLQCAHFGVPGAIPIPATGDASADRVALSVQAGGVAPQLVSRVERLDAMEHAFNPVAATDDDARRQHVARLQAVFGDSFVVLPVFQPANAADITKALTRSTDVQDGDPLAVVTWFSRASRVREGVQRLDAAIRYADAMGTGEQLNLRVAQLPYQDRDRWVGLPLAGDQPLSASRFSLIVQSTPSLDLARPLAGLLIDEWVEVLPSAVETTGMVFQFDQPNAAPPQSVLLAVPPDLDAGWTLQALQQVLLDTLALARLRTVDPQALDQIGHYLPAAYFAVNETRETVSTDFSTLG